jgi:CzcA family heavy metal efflux pump
MWIVRLALNRPYTFIVMALLMLLMTPLVLFRTPTDVFPEINIPVVAVIWNYPGFSAEDMGSRIAAPHERLLTTVVNDIEHIESQSMRGRAIVKIFFQPGVKVEMALAQVAAGSQAIVRGQMPPGTQPPLVITYSASTVPILQLGLSSDKLSEQDVSDNALNFVRQGLVTVPGVGIPYPFGGKMPMVNVDMDLPAMQAKGIIPQEVVDAMNAQNLILPGGSAKIGGLQYDVMPQGSPETIEALNNLPIKQVNGATVYIRDVANVRRGFDEQTNIVRANGSRGVLLSILKTGNTSTLDIVNGVYAKLPEVAATASKDLKITPLFDQSVFVRNAISGVLHEGVIAACLTALMILLFLGSWRATLIIAVSIPLSILASIFILSALGQTINLMTLGGLALAVGMLVDDATVEIENIDRNWVAGVPLRDAILSGAAQIATPALVSTLCICIVFIPMFFLSGVAKFLFVPLAMSVVFAMLASYVLSRTIVPTLAMYLLRRHEAPKPGEKIGFFRWFQLGFEKRFERFRLAYRGLLHTALHRRGLFAGVFLAFCIGSLGLAPFLGRDFFPEVDAGQFRMHFRAKTGTRIEEMAVLSGRIEDAIRKVVPAAELGDVIDNLGMPYSGINTAYSNSGTVGPSDGEILVELNEGHEPTANYVKTLREKLPREFPGVDFFFQPADIVTQILNFGLPSPIDIQITGRDQQGNFAVASRLQEKIRTIPGCVDVHIHQRFDQPQLRIDTDRSKASQLGMTASNVSNNILLALSGSGQLTPAFWLNPANGVNYTVVSRLPDYRVDSLDTLKNIPLTTGTPGDDSQILSNLADFRLTNGPGVVTHYDIKPSIDIYATTQGRDLGAVSDDIGKFVAEAAKELPRGSKIELKGQVETMNKSFVGLGLGILGAGVLVYLLIVVNFQSWTDPFIIITALPGALAGIVWMLFITGTTLNVPSLMGAIMCIGMATANSVLVISFAKERYAEHGDALRAALDAGVTRLRPVLMTALAMIVGMIPMSLGLGEGGEQNAPLARSVIGGLIVATVATLFFVPVIFTLIRHGKPAHRSGNWGEADDEDKAHA